MTGRCGKVSDVNTQWRTSSFTRLWEPGLHSHIEGGSGTTYDEGTNCFKKRKGPNTEFYFPAGNAKTRSSMQYVKIGTGLEELSGKLVSVQVLEGAGVKLRCSGPPLTAKPEDPRVFWDYLTRQGGNWI